MPEFEGYTRSAFQFLESLQTNNNREWFNENKDDYESLIREPTLDFIASMNQPLHDISAHFVVEPKKSGGSMMRPFRDTRFSKDKTPYKTNIGVQFRHASGKDIHAPGYYIHIDNTESFIGVGMWKPDSVALRCIRESISDNFDQWLEITKLLEHSAYGFFGDSLKRIPKGFDKSDPAIEHLKRKSCLIIKPIHHQFLFSGNLISNVIEEIKRSTPFMQFICRALDIKF